MVVAYLIFMWLSIVALGVLIRKETREIAEKRKRIEEKKTALDELRKAATLKS